MSPSLFVRSGLLGTGLRIHIVLGVGREAFMPWVGIHPPVEYVLSEGDAVGVFVGCLD